jgi:putative tryptophan/tyrosine transport system substrate-binding protein
MIKRLLRLWLATCLILVASAVLLLTDRERPRRGAGWSGTNVGSPERVRSVALFQHVSQATMEEGAQGVLAGLAQSGYHEGRTIRVRRYNAEGDAATSNTIARAIIGGDHELVITLSTPSLQAVAAANRDAKRPHVFGMVSDPVVAGVGVSRDDPRKHPPYMVGLGTMQPVAETFRMARRLAPRLVRVGVAWNPSEANSEACTKLARIVSKELGIELLEANVDGTAAVFEAVASLVGRGAEAVWIGGDNTVLSSLDAVISPTRAAGVPVFTSIPGCAARGALFDLGADYHRVGESVGRLAASVLGGESPAEMPILYEVPPEFWINRLALAAQTQGWSFPPEIDAKADVVVEKGGPVRRHPRQSVAARPPETSGPRRTWKVGLAAYSESTILDETIEGLRRGLKDAGLIEGQDYATTYGNAQGDIATLSALFDELNGNETDLVVSFSTPALQAALRKVDRKPVVFAVVLDPIAAGAGKSDADHRTAVTGAYLAFPYAAMARTVREVLPGSRRVGTLFTPGEVNSVVARQGFENALKGEALELVSVAVNGPTEVSDAALSVCQSGIDVLCQISDNLSNSSFPAIARACEMAKMPLFTFSPSQVKRGAVLGVGSDYSENGREAGRLVALVIRGKDPARIPFHATTKITRSVNLDNARRLGVSVPAEWVKSADEVVPAQLRTQ